MLGNYLKLVQSFGMIFLFTNVSREPLEKPNRPEKLRTEEGILSLLRALFCSPKREDFRSGSMEVLFCSSFIEHGPSSHLFGGIIRTDSLHQSYESLISEPQILILARRLTPFTGSIGAFGLP